ncbi:MAG: thermonuclease family protein [Alphaproteobacteria bacterium]|nr:thermonuclease family protein [Alphaproteobacteria bacterium]
MFRRRHRPIHYRPRHSPVGWWLALAVAVAGIGVAAYWAYESFGGLPSLTLAAQAPAREPPRVGTFVGVPEAEGPTGLRFEATSVMLHGIEPPGPNITCASGDCGASARNMLGRVVGRRELLCVTRARSEGRVFVTCYLPDGSDIGAALVARGWAVAAPETSFYRAEEERARTAAVGIWARPVLPATAEAQPGGEGSTPEAGAAPPASQPDDGSFVPPDD